MFRASPPPSHRAHRVVLGPLLMLIFAMMAILFSMAPAAPAQSADSDRPMSPRSAGSEPASQRNASPNPDSPTKPDSPIRPNSPTKPDSLTPEQFEQAVARWSDAIEELERLDTAETDPEDAVLLIGSSSIRLWEGATEALKPYPVIRRGYGGAKYSDLLVYAKRLIQPHTYRAIVFFVGNDVSGNETDHAVDDVQTWVRAIVQIARQHQPDAAILLVEVTPTPVRFQAWPKIRQLNAMLREVALTEPNTSFVATAEFYLDRNDLPRDELFRDDRLHQNEAGYQVWASLIRRRLDEVLAMDAIGD